MAQALAHSDFPGAVIIPFPRPRSCFTCANSRALEDGATWCAIFEEVQDSEIFAAEGCLTYERCEDGDQSVLLDDPRES
jgi:hypothetical protein